VLADDDPRWKHGPVEQAAAACRGGADVVQLRGKLASDREALAWANTLRKLTRESGVIFVVNDRFDLALLAEADGVHLGQDDLAPSQIPLELRTRLLVGRSTHTLEQVRRARDEPIDYLAFGPVFGTSSKQSEYDARGRDALARVVELSDPLPVVAIGGIDRDRIAAVGALGAGAAVISAVAAVDELVVATRDLARRLREGAP
jgi:thiamine-phosphate pyrophosphorylase